MTQPALHLLLHAYKELLIYKYTLGDAGHHWQTTAIPCCV